jgi:hypothetical protein
MRQLALRCTFEGCSEGPSRSSPQEDGPWGILQELLSGSNVAKVQNAIAVADGERGGEARYMGRRRLRLCVWVPNVSAALRFRASRH